MDTVDFADIPASRIEFGVQKESGTVALRSIETATKMTLAGEIDAIVTAPISKMPYSQLVLSL